MLVALTLSTPVLAQGFWSQFRDDDGWFDASDFVLENTAGFMPVPILITEPAVEGGLGLAALFFHAPEDYDPKKFEAGDEDFVVPNISAVAGAYTGNGSWLVGGGHFAWWKDDTIRYEGAAGYASMNLRFYGANEQQLNSEGFKFTGDAAFLSQPISFRMGSTDLFIGGEWIYADIETRFDLNTGIPDLDNLNLNVNLSSLEIFARYDTRDNEFTPNSGFKAEIGFGRNDEALGSDFNYNEMNATFRGYRKFGSSFVLGGRLDARSVGDEAPFFALPFVDMRGIKALRYQGQHVAIAELEGRWAFHPRFSLIGFAGLGRAADSWSNISSATSRVAKGLGIRYFTARKLGMHVGIDIAQGPEDSFFYITIGSAWR